MFANQSLVDSAFGIQPREEFPPNDRPRFALGPAICLLVLGLLFVGLLSSIAAAQQVTLTASSVEATTAMLTITNYSGTWYYQHTTPAGGTCSSAGSGTTASLTSLSAGTNHVFKAYSDDRCSTELTTNTTDAKFLTRPGQISQPSVSLALGKMAINWSFFPGMVTKYRLQWKSGSQEYSNSTGDRQVDIGHPMGTWEITTVGTRVYTFRIRAGNGTGWGDWSEEVSATAVCSQVTCPWLATESVGATTVTLKLGRFNGLWHYKYTTPTGGTCSSAVPSGTPTTAVTGLEPNTSYVFKAYTHDTCLEKDLLATAQSFMTKPLNESPPAPATVPATVPATATATSGNGQATLTWSSTGDSGSSITGWQYQQKEGTSSYGAWTDVSGSGPATTSHTVTGLTNGTTYRFRVRAVNSAGPGAASAESAPVTPSATPPAPTLATATFDNGQVTLTWTSTGDGGAPITGWEYQQKAGVGSYGPWMDMPGSSPATTSHTVTGLTNGTPYRFKVRAVNSVGPGAASAESAPVTPSATPPAPSPATATFGNDQVTLAWSSTGDGGSPITGWEYQQKAGAGSYGPWRAIPGSGPATTSHRVTGLTNGTPYRFKVRAVNSVGPGAASAESAPVTPSAPPPAPAQPVVMGSPGQVTLTWSSTGDGGSPIIKWEYQQKAGAGSYGSWMDVPGSGPTTTSHTVTGLTNTTAYQFRVRAVNVNGPGAASVASDPVRPVSAAEQALLTNVLAAQGRALLTGATEVIGQRFRAASRPVRSEGEAEAGAASALGIVVRGLGLAPGRGSAPVPAFGAQDPLSADTGPWRGGPRGARPAWPLDQLAGRSFALPLSAMGAKGLQGWTLWGAGAAQRFEGATDVGQYDGPLSSLYLGLDTRLSPAWLAGAAVSHSWGDADYTRGVTGGWRGRLETRLTSVYPYVQGTVANDLELWALGGYGWGEVENRGGGPYRSPETSDLTMAMGATGLRQPLTERAGVQVALVGSGGYLALSTGAGLQAVADLSAEVLQARVALEATRAFGAWAPYLQVGGRADGGDGQTGTGLETVAGVRYTGERVAFEARGRWLATHSADGYEEYGGMARLAVQPRPDGTGLRLSVAPSWGRADATGALWGDGAPRLGGSALSTLVPRSAGNAPALELASDLGYGVPLLTGILTPSVAYGSTGGGSQASLGLAYAAPPTARVAGQNLSLRLGWAPPATIRAAADYRLELLWSRGF